MRHSPSLLLLGLSACAAEGLERDHSSLAAPTATGHPPGTYTMVITAVGAGSTLVTQRCHAILVAPRRLLTTAHCFDSLLPWTLNETSFSVASALDEGAGEFLAKEAVRFHPSAWTSGKVDWSDVVGWEEDELRPAFDLATIDLPSPSPLTPIPLYATTQASRLTWTGKTVTVPGRANDAPATGTQTLQAYASIGGAKLFATNPAPSTLQHGDSGGGATLVLPAEFPAGESVGAAPCAVSGPTPGTRVLIGLSHATTSDGDLLTPVVDPVVANWILDGAGDVDGDGRCEADDNCPTVPNPDQANCNALAELDPDWKSNGRVMGDACDPTPCSYGDLAETGKVVTTTSLPVPGDGTLITKSYGRSISDRLDLSSVIATDADPVTIATEVYFCLCRQADGTPIADPAVCEAAPFHCTLDPLQFMYHPDEVSHGLAPAPGETYWRKVTLVGAAPAKPNRVETTHPGASSIVWDYASDYARWLAAGAVTALPTDPKYGPGTDLGGVIWIRSETTVGAGAHDLAEGSTCGYEFGLDGPNGEICSISDHLVFGVAPDAKASFTKKKKIPTYRPAPWWSYCASCFEAILPGQSVYEPHGFVTLDLESNAEAWTKNGAIDVSRSLTASLRRGLADASARWVGMSEPLSYGAEGLARAMMLSVDGATVRGSLVASAEAFDLVPTSVSSPRAGRTGFAAAYSRTQGALFVVGGVSPRGLAYSEIWTYRRGRWTSAPLADPSLTPRAALAAVYSPSLARVLVIDARDGRVSVLLVDPVKGGIVKAGELPAMVGLADPSLTLLDDGRVVAAGNTLRGTHRVQALTLSSRGLRVGAVVERSRRLALAPVGGQKALILGVEVVDADGSVGIAEERVGLTSL